MRGGVIIKIYHTLGGQYLIHGREFPKGTVVLQLKMELSSFAVALIRQEVEICLFWYMIHIRRTGKGL